MRILKFLFLSLMDFVAAIFIGAFIGFVFGIGIVTIQGLETFKGWRLLDSPVKYIEIVDATAYEILAKSTEGKIYEWKNWDCQLNQRCNWSESGDAKLYKDEDTTTARKDVCQYEGYPQPKSQSGNIVECIFTTQLVAEKSPIVYYAILDDGTIWSWPSQRAYGNEDLQFVLICILIGVVAGIIIGIVIVIRKEARSKYS